MVGVPAPEDKVGALLEKAVGVPLNDIVGALENSAPGAEISGLKATSGYALRGSSGSDERMDGDGLRELSRVELWAGEQLR